MQFLRSANKWDGELVESAFLEWFLREAAAGDFELVAAGLRTLDERHANMVAKAFLELERRHPLRPGMTAAQQQELPVSRLADLMLSDFPPQLLEVLFEVGFSFRDNNCLQRGLHYLEQLGRKAEAMGDLISLGRSWQWRGLIYTDMDEFERDLPCYWKALSLFQSAYSKKTNSETEMYLATRGLAHVQHQLAIKCHGEGELDHALLYNYRCLAVRERLKGDDRGRASSHANIGLCLENQGKLGRALLHYLRDVMFANSNPGSSAQSRVSSDSNRSMTFHRLGNLAMKLQEPAVALLFFEKVQALGFPTLGREASRAQSLMELKRYEEALQTLEGLRDSALLGDNRERLFWYSLLIAAASYLKREEQAGRYREELIDELMQSNIVVQVADPDTQTRIRDRIQRLAPEDHSARGMLHAAAGEREQAREEIGRALESCSADEREKRERFEKLQRELSGDSPSPDAAAAPDASPPAQPPLARCRACQTAPADAQSNGAGGLCQDCQSALQLEQLIRIPAGEATLAGGGRATVASFFMDKYPVTNRLFRIYHRVTKQEWKPTGWTHALYRHPDQPITGIAWKDCEGFCAWRSRLAGRKYRLPSMEEWYRAALGDDGRKFPWGNEEPDHTRAAYSVIDDEDAIPAPIGLFPQGACPFGLEEMAGNVWEWTSSIDADGAHVFLGGSSASESRHLDAKDLLHQALWPRKDDSRDYLDIGFRCVGEVAGHE